MKNKKGLIIGSVIAVIVIVAIAIAVLYFTTDLFKTNQQLFYQYLAKTQIVDTNYLQKYAELNEKLAKNNNSSSAIIDFSTSVPNQETGISDVQTLFTIKSNGLVNVPFKQTYRDFTLSSNNQNWLTLKYMRDDNLYAIGADNILAKYIAVENSNLKELFTKMGVQDVSNVPDTIPNNYEELLKIDEVTLKTLGTTYGTLIYNHINEANYYKTVGEDKTETIGISMSEQELFDLVKVILKTAQNDNVLLDLIVSKAQLLGYTNLTVANIQSEIQKNIEEITNDTYRTEKDFVKIELVKKDKIVIGINVEIEQTIQTLTNTLEFTEENFDEKNKNYRIELNLSEINKLTLSMKENEIERIKMIVGYDYNEDTINLNTQIETKSENQTENAQNIQIQYQLNNYQTDNILQNCVINIDSSPETSYQIKLSNETTLKQDVQIEKLTSENSAKLNDMTSEQISQLFTAIVARVMTLYGAQINSLSM